MTGDKEAEALKAAVAQSNVTRRGMQAYPAEVRARAAAWAGREMSAGAKVSACARVLGMHSETLRLWLRTAAGRSQQAGTTKLRAVRVVAERAARTAREPERARVFWDGQQARVEGLDVAGVAELLRGLR